jgi:hypothetical protein
MIEQGLLARASCADSRQQDQHTSKSNQEGNSYPPHAVA